MRRKVIQIAESTQLISLPRKWCIENNIKKGDELEIEPSGKRLFINTDNAPPHSSVEVDVSGLDRSSIMFIIRALYKKGYDEIKITYSEPKTIHFRTGENPNIYSVIRKEANRCSGLEIIEQKENCCVLKAISVADPKEFENILRRTLILISNTYRDLIDGCKNNNIDLLNSIEEKHDNVTRFINHCCRLINKRKDLKNSILFYNIVSILDKVLDTLKNSSRDMKNYHKKVSKTTLEILEKIYGSYELYRDFFYSFDSKKVHKLTKYKEEIYNDIIKTAIVLPKEELLLLHNMHQTLELYRGLTESRIAIEF